MRTQLDRQAALNKIDALEGTPSYPIGSAICFADASKPSGVAAVPMYCPSELADAPASLEDQVRLADAILIQSADGQWHQVYGRELTQKYLTTKRPVVARIPSEHFELCGNPLNSADDIAMMREIISDIKAGR